MGEFNRLKNERMMRRGECKSPSVPQATGQPCASKKKKKTVPGEVISKAACYWGHLGIAYQCDLGAPAIKGFSKLGGGAITTRRSAVQDFVTSNARKRRRTGTARPANECSQTSAATGDSDNPL